MAKIKCNFEQVFAQFKSLKEVNEVANDIRSELINAYNARIEQLGGAKKKEGPAVSVSVSASADGNKKGAATKKETKAEKKPETKAKKDTKAEKNNEVKTSKEKKRTYDVEQVALSDTKALKKLGLKFIPYNDKCLLLTGETKPIAQALNELKAKRMGVFANGHLKAVNGFDGGFGWLVNKENENFKEVCKLLKVKAA